MKRKTQILLVDDEPDILEIVGYNLTQEGYQIFTAANGKAIAKKKEIPDLIIMDVMMPMDGMEACENIRKIRT
jgi:two-component system alkaline phosphatase synthesis response regulator PhoP